MTDKSQMNGAGTQTADRPLASGEVHEQMTALDTLILQLREEVDRLLASANARTTVATLERAAIEAEAEGEPEAVRGDGELAFGHEAPVFGGDAGVRVAPAADEGREDSAPDDPDYVPQHGLEGEWVEPSPEDEQGAHADEGATVIEFPTMPEPKSPFSSNDETDAEAAFGALLEETAVDAGATEVDAEDSSSASEGVASIETAGATTMPADWNDGDENSAFDKFFSDEVEPEPAQRWLLNE